mmetsp:Transcript_3688/g.16228  ORF Transcript_3688/g.16228 Transcript_3688/m.16228 type:complete len:183 (+) Transcript_3688:680-1228(+)
MVHSFARHYGWLHTRLSDLGSEYGAYPVHDLIWQAARTTKSDLAERLAIGQLVQEARGLDAAPRVADRLRSWNDNESAKIVAQIGVEEVDHVKMGVKWYLYLCKRDEIEDPISNFHQIALKHANYGALSPTKSEEQWLDLRRSGINRLVKSSLRFLGNETSRDVEPDKQPIDFRRYSEPVWA